MSNRSKKAWAKWRRLILEQARSGQTIASFCQERGLCRPYFFTWKKRLKRSRPAKFLEVQVVGHTSSPLDDPRVEVRLPNGRILVVKPGFDAEHVRALVRVLETV